MMSETCLFLLYLCILNVQGDVLLVLIYLEIVEEEKELLEKKEDFLVIQVM